MRVLIVLWAVLPVLALLLSAIVRLSEHVVAALQWSLDIWQWCALLLSVTYMLYAEGYKGFQNAFSPRFSARLLYVRDHGTWIQRLLAPIFCFGYFHSTPRRLIASYALTAMIICLVFLLSYVPQPWRGIIDAGVVSGLIYGVVSLVCFIIKALISDNYPYSPELPNA